MTSEINSKPSSSSLLKAAQEYARQHKDSQLDQLKEFLRIPSISTSTENILETAAAAEWLARAMKDSGLDNVEVIETDGNPLVYGDWLHAGREVPTVLIYGHYDVQPADPLESWDSPPFDPQVNGDHIYARGASDDKGQLYIHVKSVESYLKGAGRLPVNVKFIFEGEEESGSRSLTQFVPSNTERLAADSVLVSDTHIAGKDQPSIVYGLRGMCYTVLNVTGPSRDLHSGSYGGGIDNPLNVMAHIIAALKDGEGRILIPGFYEQVTELSDHERQRIAESAPEPSAWLADAGAPRLWGEPEYTLPERLGARPTLDVNGLVGGYTKEGAKTVLPSGAHAKISMRLVPDQDPHEIFALFRDYVQKIAPDSVHVECKLVHEAMPCVIDTNISEMQAAVEAYAAVFGCKPVFVREGGSIPVISLFQEYLGLQTVLMGFGLADDHIHSPNERLYLPNFYRGIETAIHYLDILGSRAKDQPSKFKPLTR